MAKQNPGILFPTEEGRKSSLGWMAQWISEGFRMMKFILRAGGTP